MQLNVDLTKSKKILFINSKKFDYAQDLTYAGLVSLVGKENVHDWPRNYSYHFNLKTYPKNLGYEPSNPIRLLRNCKIDYKNADVVILGSTKKDALESYLRICQKIPGSTPVILIEGGDIAEIGGDTKRLNFYPLWQEAIKKRAFSIIFKREFLKYQKYPDNVFPYPFCMNLDALNYKPQWQYDKDVSFWATESHPIRTQALDLLKNKFDCDQNGTARNQTMKHFKLKGKKYSQELGKCKISISLRGGGWDTLRYWEIPAHGSMMVSQRLGIVIPNDFRANEHIAYCKDDLSDLLDICHYYLDHEDERIKMVRAALDHLVQFHTPLARAKYIFTKISS